MVPPKVPFKATAASKGRGGSSSSKSPLKNNRIKCGKGKVFNEAFWMKTAANVMVLIPKKTGKNESPYLYPSIELYNSASDEDAQATGIIAVVDRRGVDGKTEMPSAPGSEFAWPCFLMCLEEGDGAVERKAAAQKAVQFLNRTLVDSPHYRWKQKPLRLIADRTANPQAPADIYLLTEDILSLLDEANPDLDRNQIAEQPVEELAKWFTNVEKGRRLLLGQEE
jgi:hypothetical protein